MFYEYEVIFLNRHLILAYSGKTDFTRPTSPVCNLTFMPCGCSAELVNIV